MHCQCSMGRFSDGKFLYNYLIPSRKLEDTLPSLDEEEKLKFLRFCKGRACLHPNRKKDRKGTDGTPIPQVLDVKSRPYTIISTLYIKEHKIRNNIPTVTDASEQPSQTRSRDLPMPSIPSTPPRSPQIPSP